MKNRLRFLLGLGFLLMAVSAHAQSPGIFIDQMQPVVNNTPGVITLAIGGSSQQKLAQTVTVGRAGRLRGVFLPIGCQTGKLVVEIWNVEADLPGSVLLGRHGFPAEDVTAIGGLFRFFKLQDTDLSFAAGDRFAIVLRNPTGACASFPGPAGDSYTGGEGFFDFTGRVGGWGPLSTFPTGHDLPFMTVLELP
jgi:hypothetical protein